MGRFLQRGALVLGQACRQFVPSVLRRQRTFPIVEELPDQVPQAVGFLGARVAGRPVEGEVDDLMTQRDRAAPCFHLLQALPATGCV